MQVRCPNCKSSIPVQEDDTFADLECPSCGTIVDLTGSDVTRTYVTEITRLGHFELLEQVGAGHFGTVYKARDRQLDRIVAVKIPRKEDLSESEASAFLREARAAAQLRHPNIVSVHEVGRENDTIYIVSDFIPGITLKDWADQDPLSPEQAAVVCRDVLRGLHTAHEARVIHRDLKPQNILIDKDLNPHITDFGLAKREVGEITLTIDGKILGTPAYMSPEQARGAGHHVDRRADIYSVGVIFYQLLTRQRPFHGELRLLIHQILHSEPIPPRKVLRTVPRDLETICLKAMEKDPERRYATAADMADDLQRALDGLPLAARRAGPGERFWRWTTRNRLLATSLAVVAALLIVAAGLLWYLYRLTGQPDPAPVPGPPAVENQRRVRVQTEPEGARLALFPLDPSTRQPMGPPLTCEAGAVPEFRLAPGTYLVVAEVPGVGFHEVYRMVPAEEDGPVSGFRFAHRAWETDSDGVVLLPPIVVPSTVHLIQDMVAFAGGDMTMGRVGVDGAPPHARRVAPFLLDQYEVTLGEYRRVMEDVPQGLTGLSPPPGDRQAVSFVTFHQAMAYAERVGKRLPLEAEYEFAATRGGESRYPWGDAPDPSAWPLGEIGIEPLDRTPGANPVFGLFSNVAEWIDSPHRFYPGDPALTSESPASRAFQQQAALARVIRGGPFSVVEGEPDLDQVKAGAALRHSVYPDTQKPGLGFRCARSVRPRWSVWQEFPE